MMIMQCNTPKKLGWLGALAVLGLGAIALPILPTLARTAEQDNAPGEPAVVSSLVSADSPAARFQAIIYSKEYCAHCHRTNSFEEKDSPACLYVKAQDEYRAVETRLKELQERLAKLEGRDPAKAPTTAATKAYYDLLFSQIAADKSPATVTTSVADPDAARDEVELLEAQLKGKQAQVHEVEVKLALARQNALQMEQLGKNGSIPQSEVLKARSESQILQAQLDAKRAELAEAELRLAQAKRRLKPGKELVTTAKPAPTSAAKSPSGAGKGEIKIFRLKHAEAVAMAQVLQSILADRGIRVVADPRTNCLIVVGNPADLEILETLLSRLDDADAAQERGRPPTLGPGSMRPDKGPTMSGGGGPAMVMPGAASEMGGAGAPKLPPSIQTAAPNRVVKPEPGKTVAPVTTLVGPVGMGPSTRGSNTVPADSDQRIKQLEEKLDRLETLLRKMEAERLQRDLDNTVKKALEPKK
jgi:hypothetical protein